MVHTRTAAAAAGGGGGGGASSMQDPPPDPITLVREILKNTNSWETCWGRNLTPWDLGGVTPIIDHLIRAHELPPGTAFVPGCGSGYDVVAMASSARHVVGLDISETAIAKARQMASATSSAQWVEFVCTDFFTYTPEAAFNLIFDYTFFCALEPSLRPKWAAKMSELLAPHGELITIIYPVSDHEGGPPYAVSFEAYEKVLSPLGFVCTFHEENSLSIASRQGKELLGRWKRLNTQN